MEQIFVMSLSGALTLFEADQCVFSRQLLPCLHPGPFVYAPSAHSLVTTNDGHVHCTKFSLLAAASSSSKKLTFD